MDGNLGPTFANYYMGEIENRVFEMHPEATPLIYARYVDDIFILSKSKNELEQLRNLFETQSVLKFTTESERDEKLSFLDVMMKKESNRIVTSVHTKATNNGDVINYLGICPDKYKISIINTLLHRAYRICNTWSTMHAEITRIKQLLTDNNYPMAVIDNAIKKFLNSKQSPKDKVIARKPTINFYYEKQMTSSYKIEEKHLESIVQKNVKPIDEERQISIKIYYKCKKVKSLFIKNNPQKEKVPFNVVYQYTCNFAECNSAKYIGYTEQTLYGRFKQHKSVKEHLSRIHDTRFICKEVLDSVEILRHCNNKQQLLIYEALFIKERKPELNSQEEGRDRVLHIF